jgi:hypothetical protein
MPVMNTGETAFLKRSAEYTAYSVDGGKME